MSYIKRKFKDYYLLASEIENIFINEYMVSAPAEYVKVYLLGQMYAQQDINTNDAFLAKQLSISRAEVEEAWEYWDRMGIIHIGALDLRTGQRQIEFLNLRERMYNNSDMSSENLPSAKEMDIDHIEAGVNRELKENIEDLIGRLLTAKELKEIYSWIKEMDATTDIILAAFEYCYKKDKRNIGYIGKIVMSWCDEKFKTKEDVERYLQNSTERQNMYRQVLSSLGLYRNPTAAEKKLMDKWFDKNNFSLAQVLEACGKTLSVQNPTLPYVNGILNKQEEENRPKEKKEAKNIAKGLNKYYEYLRFKAKEDADKRKKDVYNKIPRIAEIDEEIRQLGSKMSMGLLTMGSKEKLEDTKKLMRLLEEERAVLLTENNFNVDYTDIKYSCNECKDTGIREDGQKCSCRKERIGEAEIWLKSNQI